MNRLLLEIIGAAVLIAAFLWHEHHLVLEGEHKCQAQDVALANKIATDNAIKAAAQAKKLEDATYAWSQERAALMAANKPFPVSRVCHDTSGSPPVPTAPAVPTSGPASTGNFRDDQPMHPDISRPLQLSSAYADRILSDCRRLNDSVKP